MSERTDWIERIPRNHFRPNTKKNELRILEKFLWALHGESSFVTSRVMREILNIEYSYLGDLKRRYKENLKEREK